ncbi:putative Zn-dependent protease [Parabacteroides sp. PFB2-12]|uniref:M48 family metallopeptidase n=1 Tax=unclassified Parabacteroides TaxID=2649774 RepID=UPI0024743D40|nr:MULTISPECIES: M48 family metallopeptidase [unclassified Parabacteroides]MDH6342452.1 putative Zn-dependent protease [Parabacteroides sp. PM6-13]MDH6390104.1 putative Zn-dependent protease [Parabacteroides sp. PFB2-12]
MKNVLSVLIAMVILTSCGTVPLTGRKQLMLVSDQEVLTSSLTQYNEFISTAQKSTNKTQTAQVVRVGQKIAAATNAYLTNNGMADEVKNFSWEFNLVADPQMNAFCMPGGKIVVYEGLMQIVSSDDDLAVVMGHEVAHAVAKHSNERMSQQLATVLGASVLDVAVGNKSAMVQQVASTVYGLGSEALVILPFSRKHESEADYMGLILMTMAGYNPQAAVGFWQKMSAGGGAGVPEFLSTHPSDSRRINDIQSALPEMEKYKK